MKKKNLKLNELVLKSFITKVDTMTKQTVQGGLKDDTAITDPHPVCGTGQNCSHWICDPVR